MYRTSNWKSVLPMDSQGELRVRNNMYMNVTAVLVNNLDVVVTTFNNNILASYKCRWAIIVQTLIYHAIQLAVKIL